MCKHFKSRFPAFNIPRRSEEVTTDTILSDTPAVDSGVTMAKVFVGKTTLVSDVYLLKSSKQFVNSLEDNLWFRGVMSKLISYYAQVEISNIVQNILRMYHSSNWNSEPYHQNQNSAEGDTAPSKVGQTLVEKLLNQYLLPFLESDSDHNNVSLLLGGFCLHVTFANYKYYIIQNENGVDTHQICN